MVIIFLMRVPRFRDQPGRSAAKNMPPAGDVGMYPHRISAKNGPIFGKGDTVHNMCT